jgi:hypothetical protein
MRDPPLRRSFRTAPLAAPPPRTFELGLSMWSGLSAAAEK